MDDENSDLRRRVVDIGGDGSGDNSHELDVSLSDHIGRAHKDQNVIFPEDQEMNSIVRSKDFVNICLLLFLYILQGIPLGLAGSLPMILQKHKISYKEQAIFSFVHWPFSMKLLWAPIVDSIYSERFGRRKSWLIPVQYLIGIFMLILSYYVTSILGGEDGEKPNIYFLTCSFFLLNMLAATQDIAVDGWALTMLSRTNVGYASTCNTVGQTAGFFLGNVVFLSLESADFVNKYFRSVPESEGIVTLSGFLWFWSIVFMITTTLVMLLKREDDAHPIDNNLNIVDMYKMLYKVMRLKSVQVLVLILLTCKIGFSATDAATGLKLIEAGLQKENLALLAIPLVPLQIILPFLISHYITGPKPLSIFLTAYPYRLLFGILFSLMVWWTHLVKNEDGSFPFYYYIVIVIAYALHQITVYSIFVALMAFFAKVSDPAIGGTYMTLLNTICNLGGNWPATVALWYLDPLTAQGCQNKDSSSWFSCYSKKGIEDCVASGGECVTTIDGYNLETVFCVIFGFLWLKLAMQKVKNLQNLPHAAWKTSQLLSDSQLPEERSV